MYLVILHSNIGNDNNMTVFGDKIFKLAAEVVVRTTNTLSILGTYNKQLNYALGLPDGRVKLQWMERVQESKNKLDEMKNNTHFDGHEGYEYAHTAYMVFLSRFIT